MTAAAPVVRHVAASLSLAVLAGDTAQVSALMSTITTVRDVTDLVFLLARCASRRELNAATGWITATPAEFHARFAWLRVRGVDPADMDPRVVAGESAYQAESARNRKTRARSARGQAA